MKVLSVFGGLLLALMLALGGPAWAADSTLSPEANAAFLNSYSRTKGTVLKPSGLRYRILQSGFGARPGYGDKVTVYYTGSLVNGHVFDGTEADFPATFPVAGVIPGWTEALLLMKEGDHWQLVIPSSLGYGARGAGSTIPPNQTLIFDVQLISVQRAPPPRDDSADKE